MLGLVLLGLLYRCWHCECAGSWFRWQTFWAMMRYRERALLARVLRSVWPLLGWLHWVGGTAAHHLNFASPFN
jgi:hypothetical protein